MGKRSVNVTREQPFRNGLRQKPQICMDPGDGVGERISSAVSILGIGTAFA
jgi:hypothetical protein